jgi:hypothetical protein
MAEVEEAEGPVAEAPAADGQVADAPAEAHSDAATGAQMESSKRSSEDDAFAERNPDEALTQGEVSMADRSGQFLKRFIRVTNQYITLHSVAGSPPLDRINFQDIKSIISCEGQSRSAQAYCRPSTTVSSDEANQISEEMKTEPLTDFIISTTEDGYYRGKCKQYFQYVTHSFR